MPDQGRRRLLSPSALVCLLVVLSVHGDVTGQSQTVQTSGPSTRLAEMQHHFLQVTQVHEAVIRGDLAAVAKPALELSRMPMPEGLPMEGGPFLAAIRRAGARAAVSPNLRSTTAATVTMLQQCAGCHRIAGVYPAPPSPKRQDVGGVVGHMLEHQRAADALLLGLIVPSEAQWKDGAERLATSVLHSSDWPPDRALTLEIRKAEVAVHALADRAARARSSDARAAVYADLLTTCASCHSLRARLWGPEDQRPASR